MKADTPSATAILIAKSLVFAAGDARYRALMPREMVELSRAFLAGAVSASAVKVFGGLGRLPPARWLVRLIERTSVPGMIGHYILRKRRFEELVGATAARFGGLDQLVIMGAGLDPLGTRMARARPDLRVYEMDHPATSAAKKSAFTRGFTALPHNLTQLAVDLGAVDPRTVLRATRGFSFEVRTLFIAEGVFMYLTLEAVGRTLDILLDFPETSAAFAFTYMSSSDQSGRPAFVGQKRSVDRWLGRQREPFVWGATPAMLDEFIRERKLRSLAHADAASLRAAYLTTGSLQSVATAVGENIAWVERA